METLFRCVLFGGNHRYRRQGLYAVILVLLQVEYTLLDSLSVIFMETLFWCVLFCGTVVDGFQGAVSCTTAVAWISYNGCYLYPLQLLLLIPITTGVACIYSDSYCLSLIKRLLPVSIITGVACIHYNCSCSYPLQRVLPVSIPTAIAWVS